MDNIFAKASPPPSHSYAKLLTRKQLHLSSSDNCFAKSTVKERHLYTPRGIIKGHRRTCSIPTEEPVEAQTVSAYPISSSRPPPGPLAQISFEKLELQIRSLQLSNLSLERTNRNLEDEVARLHKLLAIEARVGYI